MSTRRKYWTLVAVFAHLALVTAGAAYYNFYSWGAVGKALDVYGAATGANSSYGFFAPDVGGQVRARFEITDKRNQTRFTTLEAGFNHESDLRINGIISSVMEDEQDPDRFARSLSASFAGTLFGRYPDARRVRVIIEEFWPISMAEHREGKRPAWREFYQVSFEPAADDGRVAERGVAR